MVNRSSHALRVWFLGLDSLLVIAAWLGAYWIRFESEWIPLFRDVPDFSLCLGILPMVLIVALVSFRLAGFYEIHRLTRFREEVLTIAKGIGLAILLIAALTFALRYQYESRITFVVFAAIAYVGIVAGRRLTWFALGRLRARGYNQSHALIVGTGRLARRTARSLREVSWMGIQTVAYVEDNPDQHATDLPVVGPIAQLPQLVNQLHIEHVFIALPLSRYHEARQVFDALSQTIVDVRLVADVPALAAMSLTTSQMNGMTFVGLRESPYHGLNVVVKRFMDVVLSFVALVLLAPLMLLIALLVKCSSRGPVFYRQERCSLNGESFPMLKFRSMRMDAEQHGPQMTGKDDKRVTRIGKILRVTNLDELPQLFNVLRGEMSLVGPRPERPVFVKQFQKSIPNYMARHAVKCGMTGWAQVNGWRGNSSLRKRVQHDLYYITHWNPWFDLRIMVLTVWRMLINRQKHNY
jgi:Undecaprenyl-phosphate glucose phosphotransferase